MKKKWLLPIFASLMVMTAPTFASAAETPTEAELTTTARDYLNTPYVYGGTTRSGLDCSGFTSSVFKQFGIDLERTSSGQYNQGKTVAKADLQVGDLVFFNTSGKGISHVGIYIGDGNMISAETSNGVKISSINDPYYWGDRYIGAKRVVDFSSVKDSAIDFSLYASRAEVANQLAKSLNLDTTNTVTGFADVKTTNKNAGAITAVKDAGIFSGDSAGKFNPNSPMTRSQLALVLVKAYDLKPGNITKQFTDISAEHHAAEAIHILASNGIVSGKEDGTYGANDVVTLKQLEAFITSAKNVVANQ